MDSTCKNNTSPDIYGIIYCITNIINNKKYIGATTNFKSRKLNHKANRKRYCKWPLYKDMNIYGWENFEWEIICNVSSQEELYKTEKFYIKERNTFFPNGYNKTTGGLGIPDNKHSQKTIEKISNALKGDKHPFYNKRGIECHNSKKVLCVETNIIYGSAHEASRETGIDRANICKCCNNKIKSAGNFHWQYIQKENKR